MFEYVLFSISGCTTLITFDDLPTGSVSSAVVPNGYKNLNWNHLEYINASSMPVGSGYTKVRSQPNVVHNPSESNVTISAANGTRFSFDSMYLTSAWRDDLVVSMGFWNSSSQIAERTYSFRSTSIYLITCPLCINIDTISLFATGGSTRADLPQNGTQFIIDNLCVSFQP
jgi:hypothetical protein